jgi:hypothetical protein
MVLRSSTSSRLSKAACIDHKAARPQLSLKVRPRPYARMSREILEQSSAGVNSKKAGLGVGFLFQIGTITDPAGSRTGRHRDWAIISANLLQC